MTCATVIVPTRNEADNAETLALRATAALARHNLAADVLFVDDSDDRTPAVLEDVCSRYPGVGMLHRPRYRRAGGLAGAVLDGIASTGTDVVAVMDGDLQHPPELLGALLPPVIGGEVDIAMATRYRAGASAEGLDGPTRRLVSGGARRAVGLALPQLRAVSDPLGGYFALRRAVLEDAPLQADGFKILLEILASGRWERTVEVPYSFAPRAAGTSSATVGTGLRFARQLSRLARLRASAGVSPSPYGPSALASPTMCHGRLSGADMSVSPVTSGAPLVKR